MKMCKGNGNTTTLIFSLKTLATLASRKKRTSEHHSKGTLQEHSFP
jgi:hypothetical protein